MIITSWDGKHEYEARENPDGTATLYIDGVATTECQDYRRAKQAATNRRNTYNIYSKREQ